MLTLVSNESDEKISVIKVSSLYGSKNLILKLKRSCVKLDSSTGRSYKPKNGTSLILIIEDLHLAPKDLQVKLVWTFIIYVYLQIIN